IAGMPCDIPFQVRDAGFELPEMNPRKASLPAGRVVVWRECRIAVPCRCRVLIGSKLTGGDGDQPLHVGALWGEPRSLRQQAQGRLRLPESAVYKSQTVERVHVVGLLPDGRL